MTEIGTVLETANGCGDENVVFLNNLRALYDNFSSRIEADNWKKLLDCDAVLSRIP